MTLIVISKLFLLIMHDDENVNETDLNDSFDNMDNNKKDSLF